MTKASKRGSLQFEYRYKFGLQRSQDMTKIAGFVLLEVLIALSLFSLVATSVIGFMSAALNSNKNAYLRSIAILQLDNMAERLQAGDIFGGDWDQECNKILPHGSCECLSTLNRHKCRICWQGAKCLHIDLHW